MRLPNLDEILEQRLLTPVFQPVVSLTSGEVYGYEAFVRGPAASPLHLPSALLKLAGDNGRLPHFEQECCRLHIAEFLRQELPGKLFLNVGAPAILAARRHDGLKSLLERIVTPGRVVIEVTGLAGLEDPQPLAEVLNELRKLGASFALGDFGERHCSLRLWLELLPEMVKVDPYFVKDVHRRPEKLEAMRLLRRHAAGQGTRLVAQGVEEAPDLAVIRDLGIELAQGYLLSRPAAAPLRQVEASVRAIIEARGDSVGAEAPRVQMRRASVGKLLIQAPAVSPQSTNDEVVALFRRDAELHSLPVVEGGRPVGLINRHSFMDRYALPFHRELYGRRSCTLFMNDSPLVVENSESLESLTRVLTGEDQRYLGDGFIITDGGRYLGLGTGEALVRAVTELRIQAARYANPLTFLPGNIPISQHIDRLLAGGASFTACYLDLNNFKPFNDQYGYWRGDEMIKLAAQVISQAGEPLRDFVGHVGGDDFVALFQSEDWYARCERIVSRFNAEAARLYNDEDRMRGGIAGEDRQGNAAFFPLTTIAVGAVRVRSGEYGSHEAVASAAAKAKRVAKHNGHAVWTLEAEAAAPGEAEPGSELRSAADC